MKFIPAVIEPHLTRLILGVVILGLAGCSLPQPRILPAGAPVEIEATQLGLYSASSHTPPGPLKPTDTTAAPPWPTVTVVVDVASTATAAVPAPSLTPTVTATPDPYPGLSIASLIARRYGGGELRIEAVLDANSYFTRTLFSYPSDGLTIYGFMNLPRRFEPPHPVIVASHGYIEPEIYRTIDYTTRYADALARAGFLVLHPNLRGYPPSDEGENLFRVGMAIDVLNLIAIVRQQAGHPGPLLGADPQRVGVWGHSMGGGISTRVITVDQDIRAALLYGAMSADERLNFERINTYFSGGLRGNEELAYPEEAFEAISPQFYLYRIQAAVSIHHGSADEEVPLAWSQELCRRLQNLGKPVECYEYSGAPHTFIDEMDELFMERMVEFFTRVLGPVQQSGS